VIVPGTFGTAEDYVPEMTSLSPRGCVAASLRGRGQSDTPPAGYTFGDHVSDIAAVIDGLVDGRFVLMGYSMGAAYAIGYALKVPDRVAGLVVGDYPARYPALAPTWVERAIEALPDRTRPEVARALQRDSAKVMLWDDLGTIACPVLILRGGQPEARVTPEVAAMYREHLRDVEVVTLERSGHNIWEPDFDVYLGAVRSFLERLDP
jgi:pimeloyl-ACP methyl ester carboxylesterase